MKINETYDRLSALGLCATQTDFSQRWLNRSPRYYSMIKASGREPSIEVWACLLANMRMWYLTFKDSGFPQQSETADQLKGLLEQLWNEFNFRALEAGRA